jgi:hypothetical protein
LRAYRTCLCSAETVSEAYLVRALLFGSIKLSRHKWISRNLPISNVSGVRGDCRAFSSRRYSAGLISGVHHQSTNGAAYQSRYQRYRK